MSVNEMFNYQGKLVKKVGDARVEDYQKVYEHLKAKIDSGDLPIHENYLGDNELADNIYRKKYFLKDLDGKLMEKRPEDVFLRIAAFMGSIEGNRSRAKECAEDFYRDLYEGHWIAGGRVLAGAGDLFRLKTLANCFVTEIAEDDIESIYKAASECARTYSYGGGIGVDITPLRPAKSVVHNAADTSSGAVSFMELYSQTTGLIGQSGRRGALMLTMDVKHPDVFNFLNVKKAPNWVTKQIVDQSRWTGKFNEEQIKEIEKQVTENTQVRFANISVKVSDEFMNAVREENAYGRETILVYRKNSKKRLMTAYQDEGHYYSLGIPGRKLTDYELLESFESYSQFAKWLNNSYNKTVSEADLKNQYKRDVYGDFLIDTDDKRSELAVHYSGDFMLYFASAPTREIRNLIKAREVWDAFVESNYRTAEPGLIFWSKMSEYSPSNYVGRPVISTNPCAEVPLEAGGACNLGSINLARFVLNGFTPDAEVNWEQLEKSTRNLVRFLDDVVSWNEVLNPLEKQRDAANETRRLGLGIMGISDMLLQLGIEYDSDQGVENMRKIMNFINENAYIASAQLAKEKSPSSIFDYNAYSKGPFFRETLSKETKELIKANGLRNIAITSIAPTGSISNIIKGYELYGKNYIGVSSGIEPIFALFYKRRAESFNNQFFKVFHSTVQAYLDKHELNEKLKHIDSEDGLRDHLPAFFFRTAHHIDSHTRIRIQAACQSYVDHSISSTINLPEDVEPESISDIYLQGWESGLKGITIYRDGSRFPILSTESKKTEFQRIQKKKYKFSVENGDSVEFYGDEVLRLPDGILTTPYHLLTGTSRSSGAGMKAEAKHELNMSQDNSAKVSSYDNARK